MNREEKRIVILAALGGMLELYDFAIYGTFAIYFAHQFFPLGNTYTSILETYMIFMLGFLLRPIGGLIFSHIGDEHGRKQVLVITVFLMGLASLGIACLPTYVQIGFAAPLLLLLMRLLQGLALGGELPTTYVYISEALANKRMLAFGITMAGVFSGYLFAALINYLLVKSFSHEVLEAYMWRLPFALGGIICFISYKIRKSLRETQAFQVLLNKPKLPIVFLFKNYKLALIAGIVFSATQQIYSVLTIIYMPTYLNLLLHLDNLYISRVLPAGLFVTVFSVFLFGYLFRNFQQIHRAMFSGFLISLILVPLAFYGIYSQTYIFGAYLLLMFVHAFVALFIPLYITLLFPTSVRLSGVAICYNISIALLGGTAPLLVTAIIKRTQQVYLTPMLYLDLFIFLSIILIGFFYRKVRQYY